MEIWMEMYDHRNAWNCIYLDFVKAFDSVPHKSLLNKLHAYGITEKYINDDITLIASTVTDLQ